VLMLKPRTTCARGVKSPDEWDAVDTDLVRATKAPTPRPQIVY